MRWSIAAACRSGSRSQRAKHTTIGLRPNSCPAWSRDQCCWLTADTMQTGSEALFAGTAPGRISHRREIGQRHCASARIFTGPLRSTSLRQYDSGYALMSPRPSPVDAVLLLFFLDTNATNTLDTWLLLGPLGCV